MSRQLGIGRDPRELTRRWQEAGVSPARAGEIVCAFLDTAATSMGRATHYNTAEEQLVAEVKAHSDLFGLSRDLYASLLLLPGLTDRSLQLGVKNLLSHSRVGQELFSHQEERQILARLVDSLPPQRLLKLFDGLRLKDDKLGLRRANNSRTRKLILRSLIASPRLELWSVKYRSKIKRALTHAWGVRKTSIIREILRKGEADRSPKENSIIRRELDRFADVEAQIEIARQCVAFSLGLVHCTALPLHLAFLEARTDLEAGSELPLEVLEGLRSTFHRGVSREEVLRIVGRNLSEGQRKAVQKRAAAAGIEIDFDPTRHDTTSLYVYAFEMGLTPRIERALQQKAARAAESFPARYDRVAVVLDASASMAGSDTQALRPLATVLAARDLLVKVGRESEVFVVGGAEQCAREGTTPLLSPCGATDLSSSLLEALMSEPDAVFVLSDGYENLPAGRFAEVVGHVRRLGLRTPIFHINPVFAAESGGVRELAPEADVPVLPLRNVEGLGSTMLRGLVLSDPRSGVPALLRFALSALPHVGAVVFGSASDDSALGAA